MSKTTGKSNSMKSRKSKKPQHPQSNLSESIIAGFLIIVIVVIIFFFVTGHSHLQLDLINESSKQFATNKIGVFEKALLRSEKLILNYSSIIRQDLNSILRQDSGNTEEALSTPLSGDPNMVAGADAEALISPTTPMPTHHILNCPNADLVTFWREPTKADRKYVSPYMDKFDTKYVTFEPDVGGWNNIRMQMELVLVFAAATGRTLVLPPDQPMYLLNQGVGHQKAHSFADFFPFDHISQVLPVISMDEFMAREAVTGRLSRIMQFHNQGVGVDGEVLYPPGNKTVFICTERDDRLAMWDYLRNVTSCADWKSPEQFLVIPSKPLGALDSPEILLENEKHMSRYRDFVANRTARVFDSNWHNQRVIHFISKPTYNLRLLQPFYTFFYFQDASMDRFYKRFVRDYIHYLDDIFCKAAIIIKALLIESGGAYSAFHIRRGEFQYKVVKISASQLIDNVGSLLPDKELLYIASDERNKTFFDPFRTRFPRIRFLDDYMELAGLSDMNPNYLGMVEQVVCSKGRYFVGTWFSTFSSYITRMRGYYGFHDYTVWYGDKGHRDRFHHFELPKFPFYMREWNSSWVGIDDEFTDVGNYSNNTNTRLENESDRQGQKQRRRR